jgi:RNA polymerase sigma-70 factor (ECF subfamily)
MRSVPHPAAGGRAASTTDPGLDDAELARRVLAGERQAFEALVARHGGPLLRFALTFLKSVPAAEEVVQDTWMAVLEGLPRFEGRSSLRTWMFRIVANRARTRLEREGRSVPFSALGAPDGEGPEVPAVSPDRFDGTGHWREPVEAWTEESPERLALRAETRGVLEAAIAELPAGQRAVLVLRDVEGLDAEETCALLGIGDSNQRVLLHRARTRVRLALERHMRGER